MFNLDDPRTVALLSMAGGLLTPVRGKGGAAFGQALSQGIQGGLLGHQSAKQMQMRSQQADLARKMQEAQMAEFTRGQDFNKALSAGYSPGVTPSTPVDDNGFQMPRSAPQMDFSGAMQIDPLKGMQAQAAWQQMNAKAGPQFKEVGGRLVRIDGSSVSEAYAPPEKPKDWQNPEYIKAQQAIRAAGRPNITTNVMPPREVFKDSLGLKKDFDSQPEVQGFKQVQGAWDQISTALQNPSPANDMAAATKFMKMLDPGSVVRESELMMAMQASGALDRFMNTADRVLKGHKLTPEQRKDFFSSGEALFNASKDRYSQTVQQYEGIAQQYGLDSRFIENAKPRNNGGWGIRKMGK